MTFRTSHRFGPSLNLLARTTKWLALLCLGLALLASAGYWAAREFLWPRIDLIRPVLLKHLSELVSRPLEVERIDSQWSGLNPALRFVGVVLRDERGVAVLTVPHLDAEVSWRSVMSAEPRFSRVSLQSPQIALVRSADGLWTLGGMALQADAAQPSPVLRWLLAQTEFTLQGATVQWRDLAARDGLVAAPAVGADPVAGATSDPALPVLGAGAERIVKAIDFSLQNAGRNHRITMRVGAIDQSLQGFALEGNFSRPLFVDDEKLSQWSGTLNGTLQGLELAQLARHVALPEPFGAGNASGSLTLTINPEQKGKLRTGKARAQIELNRMVLAPVAQENGATPKQPPDAAPATGRLQLEVGLVASDNAWSLSLDRLQLGRPGESVVQLSSSGAELVFERADWQPRAGQLRVGRFEVAAAMPLLMRLPLSEDLRETLRQRRPHGNVLEGTARWSRDKAGQLDWEANAKIERAGFAPVPAAPDGIGSPGLNNLSGQVQLSGRGARFNLSASDAVLIFPGLFADPTVRLDQITADLSWDAPRRTLQIRQLRLANADLAGELNGTWRAASTADDTAGAQGPGVVDLSARLLRAEAKQIRRYLPLAMGPALRNWLSAALVGGQARDAKLRLVGDLRRFPFVKPDEGTFRVNVPVKDVELAYAPEWPVAEKLTGELIFERNGMTGKFDSGQIYGVRFNAVNAVIPDFERSVLRLQLTGAGPAPDLLRFLHDSPLHEQFDDFTADTSASGDARLNLQLNLPILQLERTTLEGAVQLAGNTFTMDPTLPPLSQVGGRIEFSERGFALRELRGLFLGGPIALEGDTQSVSAPALAKENTARLPSKSPIALRASGAMSLIALRRYLDNAILRRLRGNVRYEAQLDLFRQGSRLRVQSNLVGLGSELPPPFAKAPATAWPMTLDLRPRAEEVEEASPASPDASVGGRGAASAGANKGDLISVRLGDAIQMAFERRRDPRTQKLIPHRGTLAVRSEPALPESGFAVRVETDLVDLDQWSKVFGDAGNAADPVQNAAESDTETGLMTVLPSVVNIRAKELVIAGRHVQDVVVGATRAGGYWRANLRSRGIDGYFNWRDALPGQPMGTLTARFGRLVIPESRRGDVASLLAETMPERLPGLDVAAEEFVLGETNLGALQLMASNAGTANEPVWQIDTLNLRPPGGRLQATGRWSAEGGSGARSPVRPEDRVTRLNFDLEVDDAARLLAAQGLVDVLRGGSGRLNGEIAWKGLPMVWDTKSLGGQFSIELGRGQFLKADPGLAKLIGVLNLQSLPRRLTLDFRDVFAEGFAFDRISGRVAVKDGVARTDDLRMIGTAALVSIQGTADIGLETQNLVVEVVPQLNAGIGSLAYAAVVNPAIGLGSLLANFLLREPLQSLFAYTVDVRGPWADPVVVRRERRSIAPAPLAPSGEAPTAAPAPRKPTPGPTPKRLK